MFAVQNLTNGFNDPRKIVRPRGETVAWRDVEPTTIRASLLADERGVFGVGLTSGDSVVRTSSRGDRVILLRPGARGGHPSPALQPIPQGRMMWGTAECDLIGDLLTAMLDRAGVARSGFTPGEWPSLDSVAHASDRRRWHAYRRSAYAIVNNLVREALAVAPAEALRAARRFPLKRRGEVYQAITASPRMLQLADTFPALLAGIVGAPGPVRDEAVGLVERGAKLGVLAEHARLPLALRKCRPGVVGMALSLHADRLTGDPDVDLGRLVRAFLPATTQAQRRWFGAVRQAWHIGGPYLDWVARHALELGATRAAAGASVSDIADWVRAGYIAGIPKHTLRAIGQHVGTEGVGFVTRAFCPSMAVRTVRDLSGAWHEAVALSGTYAQKALPPPWRDAETIAGLTITPLSTAAEIAAEGRAMHHCAKTLIPKVACGEAYLFGVRRGDKRIATVEVGRSYGSVAIAQMRGLSNALLDSDLQRTLRRWAGQQTKWRSKPAREAPVPPPWARAHVAVAPWRRPDGLEIAA